VTGQNYDHRKQWLVSRIRFLSYVYAVDVCAYAVMSNHYHVVLHVDRDRALAWSNEEVCERWMQLYKGHTLVDRWLKAPKTIDSATQDVVDDIIENWRERLYDISWFMRGINECIARMANEEDRCKGRFWEGRFKSQALLDEAALLSCMAYVDLNPVRADMEANLVDSDFTSIQQRLFDYSKYKTHKSVSETKLKQRIDKQTTLKKRLGYETLKSAPLMPFGGSAHTSVHAALPFTREDYFDLVDKTGRIIREDKRGFISGAAPPILTEFGINPDHWLKHVTRFGDTFGSCAGSRDNILNFAARFSRKSGKGVGVSSRLYL